MFANEVDFGLEELVVTAIATGNIEILYQLKNNDSFPFSCRQQRSTQKPDSYYLKVSESDLRDNCLQTSGINCLAVLKFLVDNNVNLHFTSKINKNSPLHLAVRSQEIQVVEYILKNKADPNVKNIYSKSPLHLACKYGKSLDMVKILLNYGADIECRTQRGSTPLIYACENQLVEIVKILLDRKADVDVSNVKNLTALHVTAASTRTTFSPNYSFVIAELLLKNGADVNKGDFENSTALHIAVELKDMDLISTLIRYGANLNARNDYGSAPMHILTQNLETSSKKKDYDILRVLLDNGARINEINEDFQTPLHCACLCSAQQEVEDIVTLLLVSGCDVSRKNISEKTAFLEIVNSSSQLSHNIVKIVSQFNVFLKYQGMSVDEHDYTLIDNNFVSNCLVELSNMKSHIILEDVSLYFIFKKSVIGLTKTLRNKRINEHFDLKSYEEKYPIYFAMLKLKYELALERREILERAEINLRDLLQDLAFSLEVDFFTSVVSEKILDYLSLKDLIRLGESKS